MQLDPFIPQLPSNVTFSVTLYAAVQAALEAGKLLKKGFGTNFRISPKELKNDVVTEYDHAAEKAIIDSLNMQFPTFSFLCEESGYLKQGASEYCWIIDPLDGTVNFAHGIPLFCISIALARNEELINGVIYEPSTQELFIAEKGLGAFLNGKKIKVSEETNLESCFASTSLSFNLHKSPTSSIKKFAHMAYQGFPLRAIGSTALNLAYIAAGRFDVYWSVGGSVNTWDMAAGTLLVEEAGGQVSQCNGRPYALYQESSLLATNKLLHKKVIEELEENI